MIDPVEVRATYDGYTGADKAGRVALIRKLCDALEYERKRADLWQTEAYKGASDALEADRALYAAKGTALREAADAYPTMLRDMVTRSQVVQWIRNRAAEISAAESAPDACCTHCGCPPGDRGGHGGDTCAYGCNDDPYREGVMSHAYRVGLFGCTYVVKYTDDGKPAVWCGLNSANPRHLRGGV